MNLKLIKSLALFCFLAELLFLTYWKAEFGVYISPLILFLSALGVGGLTLYMSIYHKQFHSPEGQTRLWSWQSIIFIIAVCLLAVIFTYKLNEIYSGWPVNKNDVSNSDIIPQIMFLVDRWKEGTFPYQVIDAWGYSLHPTYLPLQWMPFIIADKLQLDYRWIPFVVLYSAMLVYAIKMIRMNRDFLLNLVLLLLPFIAWYALIDSDEFTFSITVEQLIAGYYLFLALALFKRKALILGIVLLACLLSRYSIILWVPLLGFVLFYEDKVKLLWIAIILMVGFAVIYLPFLLEDPQIFNRGYAYHTSAAIGEWQRGDQPVHLFDGVGLAVYFFSFIKGSIEYRLQILQNSHLILSGVSVLALGWVYFRNKVQIHTGLFLLASLKIYLVVFYNFIQIPYRYLFIVPFVISFLCFYEIWKRKTVDTQ